LLRSVIEGPLSKPIEGRSLLELLDAFEIAKQKHAYLTDYFRETSNWMKMLTKNSLTISDKKDILKKALASIEAQNKKHSSRQKEEKSAVDPGGLVMSQSGETSDQELWLETEVKDSNGKTWIRKALKEKSAPAINALERERQRVMQLRSHELTSMDARWENEGASLIVSKVEGKTLDDFASNPKFWSKEDHSARVAFRHLLVKLAREKIYIHGLSPESFVFDGKNWEIVSFKSIGARTSMGQALTEYSQKIFDMLSKGKSKGIQKSMKAFLENLSCAEIVESIGSIRPADKPPPP
jgi:hypothetical protein